jgi:hypothetical protein
LGRRKEAAVANNDPRQWMWGEALDMLARAERLHRQLFQPTSAPARRLGGVAANLKIGASAWRAGAPSSLA